MQNAISKNSGSTADNSALTQDNERYKGVENEPYMSPNQLEYFRNKLTVWKNDLLRDSVETLHQLQEETKHEPDMADRASLETDRGIELRTRDRARKLVNKIDEALMRIADNSYGYCEVTGDPIGLQRLEARPIATMSLEAQERHERDERIHRDE